MFKCFTKLPIEMRKYIMLVSRIEEFIQNQNEQFPLTEAFKNGNRFYSDFI